MRRQYGERTLGHLYVYRDAIEPAGASADEMAPSDDADDADQTP